MGSDKKVSVFETYKIISIFFWGTLGPTVFHVKVHADDLGHLLLLPSLI